MSSGLLLGTPLEAAHDSARHLYPLDETSDVATVMQQRARMITDGPGVIGRAEWVLREAFTRDAAEVAAGISAFEDYLGQLSVHTVELSLAVDAIFAEVSVDEHWDIRNLNLNNEGEQS